MNHPFALDISDLEAIELDLEEELSNEEALQVEGGGPIRPIKPPEFTTLALGEEGGCGTPQPPFTKALCEDGGPIATTQAIGEEGGGCYFDW